MFLLCVMLLCVMCCTDRALVVVCVICAVAVLRSVMKRDALLIRVLFQHSFPSPISQILIVLLFCVCQKLINFLARWRKLVSEQREAEKLTAQEAAGNEVAEKLQARIRDAELRFVDATTTLNDRVAEVTALRDTVKRKKAKIEALKIQVLGEAAGAAVKVRCFTLHYILMGL